MSSETPRSIESYLMEALPKDDVDLLRHGAVLRYITPDLARTVTGNEADAKRLLGHPLLSSDAWSEDPSIREMPVPIRRELLSGWESQAVDVLRRVAKDSSSDD